jgi:hypothetical protein
MRKELEANMIEAELAPVVVVSRTLPSQGQLPAGWWHYFTAGSDAAREAGATDEYVSGTARVWVSADGTKNKLPCQYRRIEEPCKVCALTHECPTWLSRDGRSR